MKRILPLWIVLFLSLLLSSQSKAQYGSMFGNNVLLNGTTDHIDIQNNPAFNFTSAITLEAWINPTSYLTTYPTIIAKNNSLTSFEFDIKSDGTIEWELAVNGSQTSLNGGSLSLNTWTHVAATFDGSFMRIYKNGTQVGALAISGTIGTNSSPVSIGSRSGGGALFNGKTDDVRIWSIARSKSDIQSTMNSQLTGGEAGLVAYYDMNRNGQGAGLNVANKATATGNVLDGITVGTSTTPVFTSACSAGDKTPPVIQPIGNITTNTSACSENIATPNPVVTDDCSGLASLTWRMDGATRDKSFSTGIRYVGTHVFNVGITTVTYTAKDNSGNTSTQSFTVTVTETTPPNISCPANIIANAAQGCRTRITVPDAVINDNCSVKTLTWTMTGATNASSPATGINQVNTKIFNAGTTTITYTVYDASGNTAQCSFTVTVTDATAPSITRLPHVPVQTLPPGDCSMNVTVPDPSITDNCSLVKVYWTLTGATTDASSTTGINYLGTRMFNAGVTTVTYYAEDAAGNMSLDSFKVIVSDSPTIVCPNDTVIPCQSMSGSYTIPPVVAMHRCPTSGGFTYAYTVSGATTRSGTGNDASGMFNPGRSRIRWIVKDNEGNTLTCSTLVEIGNGTSSSSQTSMTACDSFMWNGNTYHTSGTYVYHTTNAAGCDSAATLYLTIKYSTSSDTTAVACDSFMWRGNTYYTSGNYVYHTMNADGCDSAITLHLTINYSTSSDSSAIACDSATWNGMTYYMSGDYSFHTTNAAGCDSTATLHLIVNYSTMSEEYDTACSSFTWNGMTYTMSGDYTFHTTNVAGCDSTATLHLTIGDFIAPVIGEIPDTTVNTTSCSSTVTTSNPTFSDECSGIQSLTWKMKGATVDKSLGRGIHFVGTHSFNAGVTTITYTAKDKAGNISMMSFTVTVYETTPPTISCQGNVAGYAGQGCRALLSIPNAVISDNCSLGSLTWMLSGATTGSSPASGINQVGNRFFNNGTTTIAYTVSDAAGNTATCSTTVTVSDTTGPSITKVPHVPVQKLSLGNCSKMVDVPHPMITDNCSVRSIYWTLTGATADASPTTGINYLNGHSFNAGYTIVTYYVMDAAGNTSMAVFPVIVNEAMPPIVVCPSDTTFGCATANNNYTVNPVMASHQCSTSGGFTYHYDISGATVRSGNSNDASGMFNAGRSRIRWTVRDSAGNVISCATVVTVPSGPPCAIGIAKGSSFISEKAEDNVSKLSATLFPNPTANGFALQVLSGVTNEAIEINVYNQQGQKIANMKGQPEHVYRFGAEYEKGNYIIEVKQGTKRATVKGLKQ